MMDDRNGEDFTRIKYGTSTAYPSPEQWSEIDPLTTNPTSYQIPPPITYLNVCNSKKVNVNHLPIRYVVIS
jgi:hypothetical protein